MRGPKCWGRRTGANRNMLDGYLRCEPQHVRQSRQMTGYADQLDHCHERWSCVESGSVVYIITRDRSIHMQLTKTSIENIHILRDEARQRQNKTAETIRDDARQVSRASRPPAVRCAQTLRKPLSPCPPPAFPPTSCCPRRRLVNPSRHRLQPTPPPPRIPQPVPVPPQNQMVVFPRLSVEKPLTNGKRDARSLSGEVKRPNGSVIVPKNVPKKTVPKTNVPKNVREDVAVSAPGGSQL